MVSPNMGMSTAMNMGVSIKMNLRTRYAGILLLLFALLVTRPGARDTARATIGARRPRAPGGS